MTLVINKGISPNNMVNSVLEISGVDINCCLQCKKCTNGCPVVTMVDTPPSEIIRQLQLNAGDDILKSDLVWMCASCETCFSRCPMKIDMAAVMDALRIMDAKKTIPARTSKVNKFNNAFLSTVKMFGRTYDIGMIAAYKIKTFNLLQDTDKFPAMIRKRKIALFPNFGADKKYIRRIFKKTSK
ncbi:MAG: 4Fe-4S dicluster domain-containing protein [Bacteroidales bacterium]|nr:MAG: 4Fe-4S dicluster domain-containing protein [Bacteroidales bacterium]